MEFNNRESGNSYFYKMAAVIKCCSDNAGFSQAYLLRIRLKSSLNLLIMNSLK
jgi:hypothetical protein